MCRYHSLLLKALILAAALAAGTTMAHANLLSVTNQMFRIKFRSFRFNTAPGSGAGGLTVRCNVIFEGSFLENRIAKTTGGVIGRITSALSTTHPCSEGGEGWFLNGIEKPSNNLPWSIRYHDFLGTLPTISGIDVEVIGMGFLVKWEQFLTQPGCLYSLGTIRGFLSVPTNHISSFFFEPNDEMPLLQALQMIGPCPEKVFLNAEAAVYVQGTENQLISITLI